MKIDDLVCRSHLLLLRKKLWDKGAGSGVIAFIGAGFSKNADKVDPTVPDMPDWDETRKRLAEELYSDDPSQAPADVMQLGKEYVDNFGRNELDNFLIKNIADDGYRPNELFHKLMILPWVDMFTTNYDTLLERASANLVPQKYFKVTNEDVLPNARPPRIVKLHGTIPSNKPWVFTERDYLEYPERLKLFLSLVRNQLVQYTFLMIGFSGNDPNFKQWLYWVEDKLNGNNNKVFFVSLGKIPAPRLKSFEVQNITPLDLSELVASKKNSGCADPYKATLTDLFDFLNQDNSGGSGPVGGPNVPPTSTEPGPSAPQQPRATTSSPTPPPPSPPFFLTLERYITQLEKARFNDKTFFAGHLAAKDAIQTAIAGGEKVVEIFGDGGIGKTRLLIEIAGEKKRGSHWYFVPDGITFEYQMLQQLPALEPLVIVFDDAHRRADLKNILNTLATHSADFQVVLVSRPGFADMLDAQIPQSLLASKRSVKVGRLSRADIVSIVESEPFNLKHEGAKLAIVTVAEGNPLIAILAAQLHRDGIGIGDVQGHDLFRNYVKNLFATVLVSNRFLEKLLAAVSALRAITVSDETLIERLCSLLGTDKLAVVNGLEDLADKGLLVSNGGRFQIKPDILSERVLAYLFFDAEHVPPLDYLKLFEAFKSDHRAEMLEAIGQAEIPDNTNARVVVQAVNADLTEMLRSAEKSSRYVDIARFAGVLAAGIPDLSIEIIERLQSKAIASNGTDDIGLLRSLSDPIKQNVLHQPHRAVRLLFENVRALYAKVGTEAKNEESTKLLLGLFDFLPVDYGPSDFFVADSVQRLLISEANSFTALNKNGPGAVSTSADISSLLLTLAHESNRPSSKEANTIVMYAALLPATDTTAEMLETGAKIFRESFEHLDLTQQVMQVGRLSELGRLAGGYPIAFGATANEKLTGLVKRFLSSEAVPILLDVLSRYSLPVAYAAFQVLQLYSECGVIPHPPVETPELRQYIDLFHSMDRVHRGKENNWDEIISECRARLLETLLDADSPDAVLSAWRGWIELSNSAGVSVSSDTLAYVLEDFAKRRPEVAQVVAEAHLDSPNQITGYLVPLVEVLLKNREAQELLRYSSSDNQVVRTVVAKALDPKGHPMHEGTLLALSVDSSEMVVQSVLFKLKTYDGPLPPRLVDALRNIAKLGPKALLFNRVLNDIHPFEGADERQRFGILLRKEDWGTAREIILSTADLTEIDEYALSHSIRAFAKVGVDWTIDWVEARIKYLLGLTDYVYIHEPLPPCIQGLLQQQEQGAKDTLLASTLVSIRAFHSVSFEQRHYWSALTDIAVWLGSGSAELTETIVDLAGRGKDGLERALDILTKTSWNEQYVERIGLILGTNQYSQISAAVIESQMPRSWSGSLVPYLERAKARFAQMSDHSDQRLKVLAADGMRYLDKRIADETIRDTKDIGW